MQFVELETTQGAKVWVNPEHVIMVATHTGVSSQADVLLTGLAPKSTTCKGAPAEVAKKLNDGLKA